MTWLLDNIDEIARLTLVHLSLVAAPILVSLIVSVVLARLIVYRRVLRSASLGATAIVYAIPSLPMLIVIPIITGMPLRSASTLQIALILYAVALLLRGACDAFASVPKDVRQSAEAMGFSRWAIFTKVELPLAGPILLVSFRVVAVSTVSLATIGAVLGIESLGSLLTDGFQRGIGAEIAAGILATMALAFALDLAALSVGKLVMPWRRAVGS